MHPFLELKHACTLQIFHFVLDFHSPLEGSCCVSIPPISLLENHHILQKIWWFKIGKPFFNLKKKLLFYCKITHQVQIHTGWNCQWTFHSSMSFHLESAWHSIAFLSFQSYWVINVALIYSIRIWKQKTKDCALPRSFQNKLSHRRFHLRCLLPFITSLLNYPWLELYTIGWLQRVDWFCKR